MQLWKHSEYFAKLFQEAAATPAEHGIVEEAKKDALDGCAVYDIRNVSVRDLERLLEALDNGLALAADPPSTDVTLSILRAGSTLSVPSAIAYARHRLQDEWAFKVEELDKLDWTVKDSEDALQVLTTAQQYDVKGVRNRAFYELLRNKAFWKDISAHRDDVPISEKDLLRLFNAHKELQAAWIPVMKNAPYSPGFWCPTMPSCVSLMLEGLQDESDFQTWLQEESDGGTYDAAWAVHVGRSGILEEGSWDPIYCMNRLLHENWIAMGYCDPCVDARMKQLWWLRDRWLNNLEDWLDLQNGE